MRRGWRYDNNDDNRAFPCITNNADSDATGGHTNIADMIKVRADHFIIAGWARFPNGENDAVFETISKAVKGNIFVIDAKRNTN